jgi:hypothetical protein
MNNDDERDYDEERWQRENAKAENEAEAAAEAGERKLLTERQLLEQLLHELNAANSHEQLEGYFNYIAEDFKAEFEAYGLPVVEHCEVRN